MNYSVCFSAKADYFAETKGLAEPAARFYTKLYLEPFTFEETVEYVRSVFGPSPEHGATIATWLHEKTFGHPYFLAFICKYLSNAARPWPRISPSSAPFSVDVRKQIQVQLFTL